MRHGGRLVAVAVLTIGWCCAVTCIPQKPCDDPMRRIPFYSILFKHCKCRYSDWSEWTIPQNVTSVAVPTHQCPSKMAWPEERWRKVISGYECEDIKEERHICKLYNMKPCLLHAWIRHTMALLTHFCLYIMYITQFIKKTIHPYLTYHSM